MSNLDSAGNLVAPFVPPGSRAGSSNPSRQPRTPNTELDRNAFLNLLVTQLRHQDPLNPMDDRDFVAQMAQFSSLEQMQNLNTTMTQAASFAMVGNTVAGISQNPVTGAFTNLLGRVESVRLINNEPWLVLGTGADAPMLRASEVEYVMEDFWMSGLLGNMNNGIMNNQNINLVGRIIQAITVDENERPIGFVEGRVDYIDFSGSVPMLMIGNQRVFPSEIVSVSDEMMLIGKQVGFYENGNRRVG
ncbi:MAG: hypothetical protein FWD01_05355, partial [Defluviitaleaceae bacterium]|nr:hypothetical protein [Defluviitaleaceae bacterium]